ncbi:aspartate kinase [Sulfurisphaera tokodaii]|uniref:Aspartokinase n=2 Tax=Sulfurisphaera tokodaii TaxID=111955 RepID=F9VNY7_SULTO|nr:aspartate kinase [Sulfurisphaera tokodaii]BAK54495.1 aspartate kinase [Sulfurisphaera tokodaii str. 7]HII73264.1 aspartate kinase [Sulfurisphaera tokodaii]
MKVIKIGGSIQKDEKDYELILDKLKKEIDYNDKNIIVTSAIKNITNQLLDIIKNTDKAMDIVTDIYDRHVRLLSKLTNGIEFERSFGEISKLADELFKIAWSVRVLDEVTPRVKDYILSFGERFAVILLSAFLRSNNIQSSYILDPPLITDENFGEANVLLQQSKENLTKKIDGINGNVIVIPGFIGKSTQNKFTTIGRGGSDYTATIVGKILGAKEVKLITEVPGIMTADPKKIPQAKTIPRLALEEAIELSQLGAKKLHPRTFDPIFNTNLKVVIEGLYEEGSTVIEGNCTKDDILKGIATRNNLELITIESTNIVGKIGSAATIMSEARNANVNLIAISQPVSETVIQLVIESQDKDRLIERLNNLNNLIEDIQSRKVSAISIVGCGLRNKEISAKVINKASSLDPIFISRGLKGVSLTFIVDEKDENSLAKELHEVILEWQTK